MEHQMAGSPVKVGDGQMGTDGVMRYWNGFEYVTIDKMPVPPTAPPKDKVSLRRRIRQMLDHIDPQPDRGGLIETPDRVAKAWADWTSGYGKDPVAELKVFEDGAEGSDEMVVIRNIPVYSHCEHHLAAIFGTATVGYLPNKSIVGLSKISRVVDIFARRLQVQERMTKQIADCIMEGLDARGAAVVLECRHMCMESRGIRQAGTITTTSALRGLFKDDATVRSEFYSIAHKPKD